MTYFGGGEVAGRCLPVDNATRDAWLSTGICSERVYAQGPEQNFWLQGSAVTQHEIYRKRGANTETFVDRSSHLACGPDCLPGCACGRFVEIANVLFVAEELEVQAGTFHPLSLPFSEIVVGVEWIAMISQSKPSVYQIDTIAPLMELVAHSMPPNELNDLEQEAAKRVLVDHVRAMYYLVADGAPKPGKNGRQRIVRKLLRSILVKQMLLGYTGVAPVCAIIERLSLLSGHTGAQGTRILRQIESYLKGERAKLDATLHAGEEALDKLVSYNSRTVLSGKRDRYLGEASRHAARIH